VTHEALGEQDRLYLREAARLAWKGRGRVEPNPMVGALLVRDGVPLAKDYHAGYGGPHAEINALRKAGAKAKGSALYVTLEPCSSRGKTPPCCEAILEAGVKKVIVGSVDPDPRHRGKGLAILEQNGLTVRLVEEESCRDLLVPFRVYLKMERPYTLLKWAMTLDGRIAARDGSSRWISGPESRHAVHRERGHADAVLVGSRTVLLDDPGLNCRKKNAPMVPLRVVLDPWLNVPQTSKLVKNALSGKDEEGYPAGPVWFIASGQAKEDRLEALRNSGVELILLEADPDEGNLFLEEAMSALKIKGINRVFAEGGGRLFTSLIEAELADQVMVFIAPKIVGGTLALSPVGGVGRVPMAEAHQLKEVRIRRSGEDALLEGFFKWHASSRS
jgi:diaminohydroxyphosphoribosylaminopyrimidine deaminase/5-amino-6-(5-phosphoribosylamino)uracil reductase